MNMFLDLFRGLSYCFLESVACGPEVDFTRCNSTATCGGTS